MKIAIIEDDVFTSLALEKKIKNQFPKYDLAFTATSVPEAKLSLKKHEPDLVILDVNLHNNESAFDMLDSLKKINFNIIFITGTAIHDFSNALNKYPTVNYLIKPINPELLYGAVEKYKNTFYEQPVPIGITVKTTHGQAVEPTDQKLSKGVIALPLMKGKKIMLNVKEVIRFESNGNMSKVVYYDAEVKKAMINKSLKACQDDFESFRFFRVHKKYLINLRFVKVLHFHPSFKIELSDGDKIPLARPKKKSFLKAYYDFKLQDQGLL